MKDSTTIFQDKKIVSVFSHLNHELVILGSLSRFGSKFIYLTQSYGEERLNETVAGLQRIGLENGCNILPNQESTYYESFLKTDGDYFVAVAEDIAKNLRKLEPDIVLCDAVEYFKGLGEQRQYRGARGAIIRSSRRFPREQLAPLCDPPWLFQAPPWSGP